MKKYKSANTAAIVLLTLSNAVLPPTRAVVTEYQNSDADRSADCEVYYDTFYDFSYEIPKEDPANKLGITSGNYTGVYDGEGHGIIVGCESYGAVISYSSDGGKTYTSKKPVYKDTGIYTTYFKVEVNGETVTGSALVRIMAAPIDYSASDYSGMYDGKEHGINISVNTEGCEILYSPDGLNYTSEMPEYKEGVHTVYYRILKDNYQTVEGNNKVIIGNNTIQYSCEGWNGIYDGKQHSITLTVSTEDCEILYSTDGTNYTSKKPYFTEAGTHTVYYKIAKEGFMEVKGNCSVVINDIDIRLPDERGIVAVGDTIELTVETGGIPFTATIKDPDIAGITIKDGKLIVKGLRRGKTTITIECNGRTKNYELTVTDIKLSDTDGTVKVGDSINFTVDSGDEPFTATVKDPEIAEIVVKDGVVTVIGLKEGKTTIEVESNGEKAVYEVTVTGTGISLSDTDGTVKVGDSINFTVDSGDEPFTATVKDPEIAEIVVKDGVVTVIGLKEGKTTIEVESNGEKAVYEVTVTKTGIRLSDKSGTVKVGDSIRFTADTGNEPFKTTVKDPDIAKVIVENNIITVVGLKKGKTTIEIECNGEKAVYEVTVTKTGIRLSDKSGTVKVGDSIRFTVDTENEPFKTTVKNPDIAKVIVENNKITVVGLKEGKTTIEIDCNGKKAVYEVIVVGTGIKLSDTSGTVKEGDSIKFTVDTGNEPFKTTVKDPDIANVIIENDVITVIGLKEGKTTIEIESNGRIAVYEITVVGTEIRLTPASGTVKEGDSIKFTVDTGNESFETVVKDPDIANVIVENGVVTVIGLKEGETTIEIESNGKKAVYKVTVVGAGIKLSDTVGTVKVGKTISFTVDTGGRTFDAMISDSSVADISVKNGVVSVKGLKAGTAMITIACNGKSVSYKITVTEDIISRVQTGDGSHIMFNTAMLIASALGLTRIMNRKKKK